MMAFLPVQETATESLYSHYQLKNLLAFLVKSTLMSLSQTHPFAEGKAEAGWYSGKVWGQTRVKKSQAFQCQEYFLKMS